MNREKTMYHRMMAEMAIQSRNTAMMTAQTIKKMYCTLLVFQLRSLKLNFSEKSGSSETISTSSTMLSTTKAIAVTPATGVLYIDVVDNVSYIWSGSAFVRIDEEPEQDLTVPVVTVSATGDVSQALNPNTFYRFGAVDSLDLTLVAGTGLVVYFGRFSTSANWGGTGLTVPSGVTEGANNPTVEASKTYEFNIMDNVLLLMEV